MSRAHRIFTSRTSAQIDRELTGTDSRPPFRALVRRSVGLAFVCALLVSCSNGSAAHESDNAGISPTEPASINEPTETEISESDPEPSIAPRPAVVAPVEPMLGSDPRVSALNVATYMAESYVYAIKTGDTSGWDSYSSPECDYCTTMSANVDEMNQTGEWTDGEIDVLRTAVGRVAGEEDRYGVHLLVERSGVVQYLAGGPIEQSDTEFHVIVVVDVASMLVTEFRVGAASGFPEE